MNVEKWLCKYCNDEMRVPQKSTESRNMIWKWLKIEQPNTHTHTQNNASISWEGSPITKFGQCLQNVKVIIKVIYFRFKSLSILYTFLFFGSFLPIFCFFLSFYFCLIPSVARRLPVDFCNAHIYRRRNPYLWMCYVLCSPVYITHHK